jgi:hypothetical protein
MRILRNSGRVLLERAAPFEELGHARQVRFQNPNSHQPSIARSPLPRASDRLCLHAPRRSLGFDFGTDGRSEISQAVEQRTDRNVRPTDSPRFWQIAVTKTFLKWQHRHSCHGRSFIPVTVAQTFLSVPFCLSSTDCSGDIIARGPRLAGTAVKAGASTCHLRRSLLRRNPRADNSADWLPLNSASPSCSVILAPFLTFSAILSDSARNRLFLRVADISPGV